MRDRLTFQVSCATCWRSFNVQKSQGMNVALWLLNPCGQWSWDASDINEWKWFISWCWWVVVSFKGSRWGELLEIVVHERRRPTGMSRLFTHHSVWSLPWLSLTPQIKWIFRMHSCCGSWSMSSHNYAGLKITDDSLVFSRRVEVFLRF